jgi:hypothetical protein
VCSDPKRHGVEHNRCDMESAMSRVLKSVKIVTRVHEYDQDHKEGDLEVITQVLKSEMIFQTIHIS